MENASKALVMAGAILIALIVISLLFLAFSNMSSLQSGEEQRKFQEQITDFNKEYESYAKGRMYGVDVISVLNKAISYNEYSEEDERITVEIVLHDDLAPYKQRAKTDSTGKVVRDSSGNIVYEVYIDSKDKKSSLKAGESYQVRLKTDLAYEVLFNRNKTDIATFNDFKRRVFKCEKITHSTTTGKVNYMKFNEVAIDLTKGVID